MDRKRREIIKHNIKDSVFVNFFRDRENVFDLYRGLHPEDEESSIEDVSIRTVKRVIVKGYTNDLGFTVGNRYICLVEAQSYYLPAIQLRMMFYLSETYQDYLSENGMTVYDLDSGSIPIWEAYIVHTEDPRKGVYRLKELGRCLFEDSSLEKIPEKEADILMGYIGLCDVVDSVISEEADGNHKALALKALEACRDRCGRIGEYVWSRRYEVMGVYEQLFDDEENMRMLEKAWKKEALQKGFQEGIEKGMEQGFEQGMEQGREQGMEQGREQGIGLGRESSRSEIVLNMISKGVSLEDISDLTGIPPEVVQRIAAIQERSGPFQNRR